jgi:hypothetical protein
LDRFSGELGTVRLSLTTRADDSIVGADRRLGAAGTPPTGERELRERATDEHEPGGFRRADPHFF